jgi:ferredoxin--NADP+ reductase
MSIMTMANHPIIDEIPSNIYKPTSPLACTVLGNKRLTHAQSPNEVRHIVLNLAGSHFKYVEGQSLGIIPPGLDAQGKPNKLRLYSIASASIGDDGQNNTVSLCVKRAMGVDASGEVHPGICSSYLCDLSVGNTVQVTGPVGKSFLMPQDPTANLIMVATGTGVAPFRAFMKKRDKQAGLLGKSLLYFGAQTQQDDLYPDEFATYATTLANFKRITAFSRETKTTDGQRMYVQHRIQETADELIPLLQQPNTYLFLCGLKGMETGIIEGLSQAAKTCGIEWQNLYEALKSSKRWHVEVY